MNLSNTIQKAKDVAIGYVMGYGISIILTIAVLIVLLTGWSPIPKRISEATRKPLPTPYGVEWYDAQGNKHIEGKTP